MQFYIAVTGFQNSGFNEHACLAILRPQRFLILTRVVAPDFCKWADGSCALILILLGTIWMFHDFVFGNSSIGEDVLCESLINRGIWSLHYNFKRGIFTYDRMNIDTQQLLAVVN